MTMSNGRAKAACGIGWTVLAAAFALFAFIGVGPRFGGYRTLTVLTGSMRPSMPPGSLLVVTREPVSELRPGQVIVYAIPVLDHRIVSHRVVSVTRTASGVVIQTKGDANDGPDPWRAAITDQTVWRVRDAVPHLGAVVRMLRSPDLRRIAIFLVPFILAVLWLRDIWRPEPQIVTASGGHA